MINYILSSEAHNCCKSYHFLRLSIFIFTGTSPNRNYIARLRILTAAVHKLLRMHSWWADTRRLGWWEDTRRLGWWEDTRRLGWWEDTRRLGWQNHCGTIKLHGCVIVSMGHQKAHDCCKSYHFLRWAAHHPCNTNCTPALKVRSCQNKQTHNQNKHRLPK